MSDPTTTNKGYAIPVRGTDVGTWDVPLNGNFDLIDNNFGGVATLSLTNANVVLNSTQYQCACIRLTGTLTGNVTITFPQVGSFYIIDNLLLGGSTYYALLTTGAGGGRNIATQPGTQTLVFTDGTDFKFCNLGTAVGTPQFWYTSTMPVWVTACSYPPYLLCNGGTFSAVTYPYLNAFLGGTTLPDMRGRTMFMLDQGAGRLTGVRSGGINANALGNAGGEQDHIQILAELVSHNHVININDPGHSHLMSNIGSVVAAYGGSSASGAPGIGNKFTESATTQITASSNNTGSSTSFNVINPGITAGIVVIRAA